MKTNRVITLLLLAALTMTALLTGCGRTDAPDTTRDVSQSTPEDDTKAPESGIYSNGLKFELNEDGTGYVVTGIGTYTDTELVIPSTCEGLPVTGIGEGAFEECASLTSVTIPEGVTAIGNAAFWSCSGLTSVTIPEGVTEIGHWAFTGCTSLTSISIPEGVTAIGDRAFAGCTSLTSITIPGSVTEIYDNAFTYCTSLTSVTILEGVTVIAGYAFADCYSLTNVTIPGSVTYIGADAFAECTSLTTIQYGGTMGEWEKAVHSEELEDYNCVIICTGGTLADNTETNPGTTEPDSLPQYVEWLPALTDEQLEMLGENDVLHDKYWLNNLHDANNTYTLKRHPGDATSISIYYLDEARVAFFIFKTDNDEYVICSDTYIYKYTLPDIRYYPTLEVFNPDRYFSRGFVLYYVIDETNYPEILDFFNDDMGKVYSDNDYKDLFGLTISDLQK